MSRLHVLETLKNKLRPKRDPKESKKGPYIDTVPKKGTFSQGSLSLQVSLGKSRFEIKCAQ